MCAARLLTFTEPRYIFRYRSVSFYKRACSSEFWIEYTNIGRECCQKSTKICHSIVFEYCLAHRFRGIEKKIRLPQKAFNGGAGDALLGMMAEDDAAFPVGERDQADGDPVLIDGLIASGAAAQLLPAGSRIIQISRL